MINLNKTVNSATIAIDKLYTVIYKLAMTVMYN